MSWLQTGATQYHAQLEFPDKGRAIKLSEWFGLRAIGPAKQSSPTFLSTIPWVINI